MFTYIDFSEVVGGASVACDRLPPQPAVYAFFRNVRLPSAATADDFLALLLAAIETRAAPDRRNKVGPLHNITLECRSELSAKKTEQLSTLVQTAAFRASWER